MGELPDDDSYTDEAWFWDIPIPPVAGGLLGDTVADMEMHLEARAALLNLLVRDPQVTALYDRWTHETSAGRLGCRLGEHLERTAWTAGFTGTADLIRAIAQSTDDTLSLPLAGADEAETERVYRTLPDLLTESNDLLDAYFAAIEEFDLAPLDAAISLLRETWRLPWPWLAWEIGRLWMLWLCNAPFGRVSVVNYWLEPNVLGRPAPPIEFATIPGESIGDALERCRKEVVAPLEAAAAAARLPTGRTAKPEIVARYTAWWYRKRIRGESIRSIAGKNDDQRKLIRYGIAQAQRWLGMTSWVWDDEAA